LPPLAAQADARLPDVCRLPWAVSQQDIETWNPRIWPSKWIQNLLQISCFYLRCGPVLLKQSIKSSSLIPVHQHQDQMIIANRVMTGLTDH